MTQAAKEAIIRGLPLLADPGRTADRVIRKLDAAGFKIVPKVVREPVDTSEFEGQGYA